MNRLLVVILLLVALAAPAQAQTQTSLAATVHASVASAAGCPVTGVSIVDPATPSSWHAQFDPTCTSGQISAGDAALAAFNVSNWTAALTAQGQYAAAIVGGLAVTSSSAPSLNATYALDPVTQFNITAETVAIDTNSAFTNGTGSKAWPDATGAYHTFTVAQFKTFATAVAQYVDALATTEQALAAGQTATWPSPSLTIP